jgi:hypothetical protein
MLWKTVWGTKKKYLCWDTQHEQRTEADTPKIKVKHPIVLGH